MIGVGPVLEVAGLVGAVIYAVGRGIMAAPVGRAARVVADIVVEGGAGAEGDEPPGDVNAGIVLVRRLAAAAGNAVMVGLTVKVRHAVLGLQPGRDVLKGVRAG